MYLNKNLWSEVDITWGLTVTLDVFKYDIMKQGIFGEIRLTVTLDVFKLLYKH